MSHDATGRESAERRRICFVLEAAHMAFDAEPRIGGAEVQFRILAEKLAALGHRVSVASRRPIAHPRIRSLDSRRLRRELQRERPDVVVGTIAMRSTVKAAVVCRLLGLDFIYRLANTGESQLRTDRMTGGNPLHRLIFALMLRWLTTRIWCQHEDQRQNLERRGLGKKLFVAVNLAPDRRVAAEEEGEAVLWIGRYDAPKRPQLFPEIARRLPHRRCVMIVPGSPPAWRRSLADLPQLRLLDYVPPEELPAHYAGAAVLVNTSSTEGFPNTFVEAACQGVPVISTDVDPGGFFARYGHGIVAGGPAAAARQVDELLADPRRRREMSRRARRYFEEVHEIERNIDRLVEHLRT